MAKKTLKEIERAAGMKIPPREAIIIEGLQDENFQSADEEYIAKVKMEAEAINKILNENQTQTEKEAYFATTQLAVKDSIDFLEQTYGSLSNKGEYSHQIKRAKSWGSQYVEQCHKTRSDEISSMRDGLSQDELNGDKKCFGARKLMLEAAVECDEPNFDAFLKSLGIESPDQLIEFKQSYIANTMTQLVGGIVKPKKKGEEPQEIACQNKASIVIGLPGAGKSTTINHLKKNTQAFHVDADAIKATVAKTFGVSINAKGMHQLSSYIRDELVAEAKKMGVNLIIEKIGDKESSIEKTGEALKASGYKVDLNLVHISNSRSRMNNAHRCEKACQEARNQIESGVAFNLIESPRMVEDASILKQSEGPLQTYLSLLAKRDQPGAVFDRESSFYACDNEVKYEGKENTAAAIPLYGISDRDAVCCDEESWIEAQEGFKRISKITERTVAQALLDELKDKNPTDKQIAMLEGYARPLENDEKIARVPSHEMLFEEGQESFKRLQEGQSLTGEEMALLTTSIQLQEGCHNIMRFIYNPENAKKDLDNDTRSLLERADSSEFFVESVVEKIMRAPEYGVAVEKQVKIAVEKQNENLAIAKEVAQREANMRQNHQQNNESETESDKK